MRLRQIGFTIIEAVVILGVLLTITAVIIAVYPPAKGSAKVVSCKTNLRQIHTALELYKTDYEGYEKVHQYVDLPVEAMRRPYKLEPYLTSSDVLYCPLCPQCAKEKLVSSYVFTVPPTSGSGIYSTAKAQMNEWFKSEDSDHPVVHCMVHDEMEYYPKERHLAREYNPPFVVWLTKDGSIRSGRFDITQGHDMARACSKEK